MPKKNQFNFTYATCRHNHSHSGAQWEIWSVCECERERSYSQDDSKFKLNGILAIFPFAFVLFWNIFFCILLFFFLGRLCAVIYRPHHVDEFANVCSRLVVVVVAFVLLLTLITRMCIFFILFRIRAHSAEHCFFFFLLFAITLVCEISHYI